MRLIKLHLEHFRRFADEHSLDLNEDLIALVGPNESGKSSVLAALGSLSPGQSPMPTDVTRGQSGHAVVRGLYVLEADDRAAIGEIHDGRSVTHASLEHRSDDQTSYWDLMPPPHRDLHPRRKCASVLVGVQDDPTLDVSATPEEMPMRGLFNEVLSAVQSTEETLLDRSTEAIRLLAGLLHESVHGNGVELSTLKKKQTDVRRRQMRERCAEALTELAEVESAPTCEQPPAAPCGTVRAATYGARDSLSAPPRCRNVAGVSRQRWRRWGTNRRTCRSPCRARGR